MVDFQGFDERLRRSETRLEALAGLSPPIDDRSAALLEEAMGELEVVAEELRVTLDELADTSTRLLASEQRYHDLFDLVPDGCVETDGSGMVIDMNREAITLLGGLRGKLLLLSVEASSRRVLLGCLRACESSSRQVAAMTFAPRNRPSFHASVTVAVTHDDDDDVPRLLWAIRDDTDRFELQEALTHAATHDPLTGTANRGLLLDHLGVMLARPEGRRALGVLFLDLDGFKAVNDRLGHAAGDELLAAVSERLRGAVRDDDLVARVGGDEFAVACNHVSDEREATVLAQRVRAAMTSPFRVSQGDVVIDAAIGIALAGESATTPEEILRDADLAMYTAKVRGGDRIRVFSDDLRQQSSDRTELENDLRDAVGAGKLELFYQPVCDLHDGHLVGVEALLRYHRPERGVLPAREFIGIAEDSGLIEAIGEWVVDAACRQTATWLEGRHPDEFTVAINLSPLQLTKPDVVESTLQGIARWGIDPSRICIDVTERTAIAPGTEIPDRLSDLRAAGVRVGLDDFGTGYSALGYLRAHAVDIVKVDRAFVSRLVLSHEDRYIVEAIFGIADVLGLTTIAEGVETIDELAALQALGCQQAQGYLLCEPQPEGVISHMIETEWRASLPDQSRSLHQ